LIFHFRNLPKNVLFIFFTIFSLKFFNLFIKEVQQLELCCKQFYECTDQLTRQKAEKILFDFLEDPEALAKCQLLLDRGDSSYSQLLAATTLTKLVSRNVQGLSLQQRIDIR
jgi:exportin-7